MLLLTIAQILGIAGKALDIDPLLPHPSWIPHCFLALRKLTITLPSNSQLWTPHITSGRTAYLSWGGILPSDDRMGYKPNSFGGKLIQALSTWPLETSLLRAIQAGEGVFSQQLKEVLHLALDSVHVSWVSPFSPWTRPCNQSALRLMLWKAGPSWNSLTRHTTRRILIFSRDAIAQ